MFQAIVTGVSKHPWLIAVAAAGILLIAIAAVLWWRERKKKKSAAGAGAGAEPDPKPAKSRPLTKIWAQFLRALPRASRGAPVALVIGNRRAGKTSAVSSARSGLLTQTSATEDPRIALYFGENQLTQELSADVWQDARDPVRSERKELLNAIAWQTPVVIVTVDPTAADATPDGLADLGRRARKLIDGLDAARATPIRVRVCLTHLDLAEPGFVAWFSALSDAKIDAAKKGDGTSPAIELVVRPSSLDAAALAEGLQPWRPYLTEGLRSPQLDAIISWAAERGPALLARLAPLFTELIGATGPVVAPIFDGIYLAALPGGGAAVWSADPFAIPAELLEASSRERSRQLEKSWRWVAAAAVAGALALTLPYTFYRARLSAAEEDSSRFFAAASASVESLPASWPDPATNAAEATAATSGARVLSPIWPLFRASHRTRKTALRGELLKTLRDYYLLPLARSSDPTKRAPALGLLYASSNDALGRAVSGRGAELWSPIPERVPADYLALTETPWTETPVLSPLPDGEDFTLDGWSRFLQRLSAAFEAPQLDDATVAALSAEAAAREVYVRRAPAQATAAQLKTLLRARGLPVDTWLAGVPPESAAQWVVGNRASLLPILELVRTTTLAPPAQSGGVGALDGLTPVSTSTGATRTSTSAPPIYVFDVLGARFELDPRSWSARVEASRASRFVASVLEKARSGTDPGLVFPQSTCTGGQGAALVSSRGPTKSIPCKYTRDVFQRDIVPPLSTLDATLSAVGLVDPERTQLTETVTEQSLDYGSKYRAALLDYYVSYRLQCSSADALGFEVTDMVAASSFLTRFLATVAKNADLGPQPVSYLQVIGENMADFAPLISIMAEEKGKYPNLDPYYAILTPVIPSLTASPLGGSQPGTPLTARLSPIGQLALVFLAGGDASPRTQVQKWLDKEGVPKNFRAPFLAPLDCAYQLGLAELEAVIAKVYQLEVLTAAEPFFWRFPFDRTSELDARALDVQAYFGPKGEFWQLFQQVYAPVLDDLGTGRWAAKTALGGKTIAVPAGLLDLARFAAQLRSGLWSDDGQPRSLALAVKPQPLRNPASERAATLSSLRCGKAAVFGFNQTPSWQPLLVPWGMGDSASVALRVTAASGGDDRYQSVDAAPSDWSFQRLLAKGTAGANVTGTVTMSWSVAGDTAGEAARAISFTFQGDPWQPFLDVPKLQ